MVMRASLKLYRQCAAVSTRLGAISAPVQWPPISRLTWPSATQGQSLAPTGLRLSVPSMPTISVWSCASAGAVSSRTAASAKIARRDKSPGMEGAHQHHDEEQGQRDADRQHLRVGLRAGRAQAAAHHPLLLAPRLAAPVGAGQEHAVDPPATEQGAEERQAEAPIEAMGTRRHVARHAPDL